MLIWLNRKVQILLKQNNLRPKMGIRRIIRWTANRLVKNLVRQSKHSKITKSKSIDSLDTFK